MGCENVSVLTVLHAVSGFDRIFFFGFSVLDDFFYGFAVSNGPQCPPPPLKIVSSVSYENILIDSTLMKHFVGLKSSQFEVLHSLLDDVSPFAGNRFPSSMLGSRV